MLCLVSERRRSLLKNRVAPAVTAALVWACFCAANASAQTVATYSFEDGTADGWSSFNGATTPVASNAAAYAGSYSLLTTTGSERCGRPFDCAERRAAGGRPVHHHGLRDADRRRSRDQCEFHDQA